MVTSKLTYIPVNKFRDNTSEVINDIVYRGGMYLLTRHRKGVAVIISLQEWEKFQRLLDEDEI